MFGPLSVPKKRLAGVVSREIVQWSVVFVIEGWSACERGLSVCEGSWYVRREGGV